MEHIGYLVGRQIFGDCRVPSIGRRIMPRVLYVFVQRQAELLQVCGARHKIRVFLGLSSQGLNLIAQERQERECRHPGKTSIVRPSTITTISH